MAVWGEAVNGGAVLGGGGTTVSAKPNCIFVLSLHFSSEIFSFQVIPLRARLGFLTLATEMKRYII